jgi:tetratricopeptide (TPR) repeat protein
VNDRVRTAGSGVVLMLALAACSCSGGGTDDQPAPARQAARPPAATPLADVSLPDLSKADDAVQLQARELYDVLQRAIGSGAQGDELGGAYGGLGMLLHAAEYFDAAEPCYRNAEQLMPRDMRWPYYLGLLYQARGQSRDAEDAFGRALQIAPDDVPALVRLGRMRLDRGDAAGAEPLFARARAQDPRSVAALAGLGQAALARQQYARAVEHLEGGLAVDPQASSLHSPLANAYRALGRLDRAESHIKQWRNTDVAFADPLSAELEGLLQSGLSYEIRGVRALAAEDWKGAAQLFREGIGVAAPGSPLRRSLHHKLGTALWMLGDTPGALQQFERVVELAPADGSDEPAARANYSLGIVAASEGRTTQAIKYLSAAVRYQPNYGEAYLALGDAQRRAGRFTEALSSYREVVRINPRASGARFGYAMALVRLGRYVEARDWLAESLAVQPDRPELAYALARILAAAPDARARDGRRALDLAQQLAASQQTTDAGETLAMAFAETGDFAEAARVQRAVIDAARAARLTEGMARMTQNLRLYERGQPCRTPWPDDHPVHVPGSPA